MLGLKAHSTPELPPEIPDLISRVEKLHTGILKTSRKIIDDVIALGGHLHEM